MSFHPGGLGLTNVAMPQPLVQQFHNTNDDSDSDNEDEDAKAGLQLTVNCSIHIKGDNNIVSFHPATASQNITISSVTALRQLSIGDTGIPMIDENGAPRPVKLQINADTKIAGSRNVVGEPAAAAAARVGVPMAQGQGIAQTNEHRCGHRHGYTCTHGGKRPNDPIPDNGSGFGYGNNNGGSQQGMNDERAASFKRERDDSPEDQADAKRSKQN